MRITTTIFITLYTYTVIILGSCTNEKAKTSLKQERKIEPEKSSNAINLLQEGDIIFQTSSSGQSKAIQLATHSAYSHCGILFLKEGEMYVLEAVQPVCYTKLDRWIDRGDDDYYVVKRLKGADTVLTDSQLKKMKTYGEQQLGKMYDLTFEWSDERMYCSELVWKIYAETAEIKIGNPATLESFDLSHPIVRKKLVERYGENIPLNEKVISPSALFESELLKTVKVDRN